MTRAFRSRHVQEDRLVECYYAERRGEAFDPPIAEHLADCDHCRGRFADLRDLMTSLADEADAATDSLFSADWLREQRRTIARRIEHVGHVARVLSFPARFAGTQTTSSAQKGVRRWVAVAAAAGLFVGVGTGLFLDGWRPQQATLQYVTARQTPAHAPRLTPVAEIAIAPTVDADEYFMSDLEMAIERPQTRELLAFDALTPHVREIRD
jgi:hypothetical protein